MWGPMGSAWPAPAVPHGTGVLRARGGGLGTWCAVTLTVPGAGSGHPGALPAALSRAVSSRASARVAICEGSAWGTALILGGKGLRGMRRPGGVPGLFPAEQAESAAPEGGCPQPRRGPRHSGTRPRGVTETGDTAGTRHRESTADLTEHLLCALFWVRDSRGHTQPLPSGTSVLVGKTHRRARWWRLLRREGEKAEGAVACAEGSWVPLGSPGGMSSGRSPELSERQVGSGCWSTGLGAQLRAAAWGPTGWGWWGRGEWGYPAPAHSREGAQKGCWGCPGRALDAQGGRNQTGAWGQVFREEMQSLRSPSTGS